MRLAVARAAPGTASLARASSLVSRGPATAREKECRARESTKPETAESLREHGARDIDSPSTLVSRGGG